jgi:hypothetical protein
MRYASVFLGGQLKEQKTANAGHHATYGNTSIRLSCPHGSLVSLFFAKDGNGARTPHWALPSLSYLPCLNL